MIIDNLNNNENKKKAAVVCIRVMIEIFIRTLFDLFTCQDVGLKKPHSQSFVHAALQVYVKVCVAFEEFLCFFSVWRQTWRGLVCLIILKDQQSPGEKLQHQSDDQDRLEWWCEQMKSTLKKSY